jgi:hypothetical protein
MAKNGKTRARKAKTKPDAPGADDADVGHNGGPKLTGDEERALFLRDKDAFKIAQGKLDAATADVRNVRKRIKADGFTVVQVKAAIALETPEGEERIRAEIQERLQAAMWVGVPWGAQLDLFEQPDRTPSVDRAYDEGKMASMSNQRAQPGYAPETEAYRSYMAGYHDHQRELAGGLKAPDDAGQSTMANPS